MTWLPTLALLTICLALSFLFSGMETGVLSLNRLQLRRRMREGDRKARLLHRFLDDPEPFLWTILVGNTLANFTAAALILHRVLEWMPGDPVAYSTGGFLVAAGFFLLGEYLPKTLFARHPNRLCLLLIRPFRLMDLLLWPVVRAVALLAGGLLRWTGGRVFTGRIFRNREELRWLMQESGGQFTREERTMINRVMDLQKLTVRSRLVPFSETVSAESRMTVQDVLRLARDYRHDLMAVWERKQGRRRVAGVMNVKRLLFEGDAATNRAGAHVRPALYLDEDKRLEDALQLMQKSGHGMAVVLGAKREEIGVLHLEDVLSVIFGEVQL